MSTNPNPEDALDPSNLDIPNLDNLPDMPSIKRSEIIIPAREALHNAGITQGEVKKDYRARVEAQDEIRARYLDQIKREREELKKEPKIIKLKIRNLKEQHDACQESLHYAKQDYETLLNNADITGKASAAKVIMERIEKEIFDLRRDISDHEALL
jgi:cell division septum initiation protein DivIVA